LTLRFSSVGKHRKQSSSGCAEPYPRGSFGRSGRRTAQLGVQFGTASLTHYGGVYLLHRFFTRIGFKHAIAQEVRFHQRNHRYTIGEMLLALSDPNRAGLLSRLARLTKDQRQPAYPSPSERARSSAHPNPRAGHTNGGRRSGVSDSQRHPIQRYQPVAPSFETGRLENWDAIAELAHSTTNPRDTTPGGWGFSERYAGTTRPQQNVHNLRGLHPTHSGSSTSGGGKPFAIGDEW